MQLLKAACSSRLLEALASLMQNSKCYASSALLWERIPVLNLPKKKKKKKNIYKLTCKHKCTNVQIICGTYLWYVTYAGCAYCSWGKCSIKLRSSIGLLYCTWATVCSPRSTSQLPIFYKHPVLAHLPPGAHTGHIVKYTSILSLVRDGKKFTFSVIQRLSGSMKSYP